jgi:lipopolysaccharide export LptBFGC system permease protein LptF
VPWAALVAVMLVFGRLSADSEITAMRACGISIMQIISPIIVITFLLTCLCVYLQVDLGPRWLGEARSLINRVAVNHPLAIFEPGRPVEFENNLIYIGEKTGKKGIKDIQVFVMGKDGEKIEQDITAANGEIAADKQTQMLNIILKDASVVSYNDNSDIPTRIFNKKMTFSIDYGKSFNKVKIGKNTKFLPFRGIFARTTLERRKGNDTTALEIELHERIALALSPIAFLLLGMPMAIRTSRRETSVGLFLSVILAGGYFFSIMIANSLDSHPEYYPQYLLWIPNVLYQLVGVLLIFRIARR